MEETLSIYTLVSSHLRDRNRNAALCYGGKRLTCSDLLTRADRCALGFLQRGVRPGEPVLFCAPCVPETIFALLALWRIGAIPHLLNPAFSQVLLTERIRQTGGKVLLVLDKFWPRVKGAVGSSGLTEIILIPAAGSLPFLTKRILKKAAKPVDCKSDSRLLPWHTFYRQGKYGKLPVPAFSPKDTAAVIYPSGCSETRGGIILTHEGIAALLQSYQSAPFGWKDGQRFLNMIPPWFATGLTAALLIPLCLRQEVVLQPSFRPKAFANTLLRDRPNHVIASTSLWLAAARRTELERADLSFLCNPYTGIANEPLSLDDEAFLNKFFRSHGSPAKLGKAFGLCELGGTVTSTVEGQNLPGSVGIPLPGISVAAFDPATGARLPVGQAGELWIDSPCRMKGYFQNSEATRHIFMEDESQTLWTRTGYFGFVSEDGSVFQK